MIFPNRLDLLTAALLVAGSVAHAQSVSKTVRPDPLDAAADVSPLKHVSAFAHYRPAGETKIAPWKEANDTVMRIGGWRVYAREAASPPVPGGGAKP